MSLLSSFAGAMGSVRPDERRDTLGAFLTLLGFMAGHALLETARDALFLAELRVSLLPWVYLTLAAGALILSRHHHYLARYFRKGRELNGWLLFAAAVTISLWFAIFWLGDWIFYVLYAWSGILATLIVVQFWTSLGDRFTMTQAKRLFAVIGSGSVIGAILGSGLARALTAVLPAQHLVLCAGIVFAAASFGPLLISETPVAPKPRKPSVSNEELNRIGRLVWNRPYLRRIAIVILLATVTFTLVDFVFKSTVARLVPNAELGEFFSGVYFMLNLVSLFIQLLVVGRLLRHVSVSTALAVMPLLLVLGALGVVAVAGLASVLLLKGADGSLRYSLHRTTSELLFVPMSAEIRGPVKSFIDVVGQRGGQALGSLLVLVILSATANEAVVAAFAALTAGAWLYIVLELKPHYLDMFRQTLSQDITATRIEFPVLDMASLETLLATLNSPDDRRVIAALDLLADQGKVRVIPGLILYHPSSNVVMHSLELFVSAGREDVLPLVDRLLADVEPDLRAASLRVRTALLPDEAMLKRGLADSSPAVQVTALVGLASSGWLGTAEAKARASALLSDRNASASIALARMVGQLADPAFGELLVTLARTGDFSVRREAVRAMARLKDSTHTPVLIGLLARRALREEVRATLVALGPTALAGLATGLADPALPHSVRRHIPHAIAAFGTQQAATILMRHMLEESDGMVRFKILRALGRMRSYNPQLPLDGRLLGSAIEQNVAAAFRFMRWRQALGSDSPSPRRAQRNYHEMLAGLLRDKQSHALERVFRLLNLQANDEQFSSIYRGFHSAKREARAGSRELIEHLVQPPLRQSLLILVDELDETASRKEPQAAGRPRPYAHVLRELLESGIESLSSFAACQIAALGLHEMLDQIRATTPLSDGHATVLDCAAEDLIGAAEEPEHG